MPLWEKELKELGWPQMIQNRLSFHGGLRVHDVSENTGCGIHTVRKHFRREVEAGRATWLMQSGEPVGIRPPS